MKQKQCVGFEKNEERSVSQSTNLAELGSKLHGDSTLKITTGNSGVGGDQNATKTYRIRIVCPSTAKVTDEKASQNTGRRSFSILSKIDHG